MQRSLLLMNIVEEIIAFIVGFFAFIPQVMYFLYTSAASFLDFLQYLIRKLAGLDVYYINGDAVEGDIVISFIKGILGIDKSATYSAISTVFWSMVIFGIILLVLTTIFSIIKAHYNYDSKKAHPATIIFQTVKTFTLMAIVPIVAILGLSLCNVLLQGVDSFTSSSSVNVSAFDNQTVDGSGNVTTTSILSDVFEAGYSGKDINLENQTDALKTYTRYDFFGFGAYTTTTTFSGLLFNISANACNRVRSGMYKPPTSQNDNSRWDNFGAFYSSNTGDDAAELVATQIDFAFANNLKVQDSKNVVLGGEDDWVLTSSFASGYSAMIALGLIDVEQFSKFNVGLVWYYYNLWGFNFIIGWAGFFILITILSNIVFGLIVRLIQMLGLFVVFPAMVGIAPLDEGNGFKQWKKQFISDAIMAVGAIVALNVFFVIMPFFNYISFFNIKYVDLIMNLIIMIAGLTMVKNFISMLSGFVGGSDANKAGEETKKAVGELGMKAINTTMATAVPGSKIMGLGMKGMGFAVTNSTSYLGNKIANNRQKKKNVQINNFMSSLNETQKTDLDAFIKKDGTEQGIQNYIDSKPYGLSQNQIKMLPRESKVAKSIGSGFVKAGTGAANVAGAVGRKLKPAGVFAKDIGTKIGAGIAMGLGATEVKNEDGSLNSGAILKGFGQTMLDVGKDSLKIVVDDSIGVKKAKNALNTEGGVIDSMGAVLGNLGIGNKLVAKDTVKKAKEKAAVESSRTTAAQTEKSMAEIVNLLKDISNKMD